MASGTADLQRDLGGAIMQSIFGALLTAGYAAAVASAIAGAPTPTQSQITDSVQAELTKSFASAEATAEQHPQYADQITAAAKQSFLDGEDWAYIAGMSPSCSAPLSCSACSRSGMTSSACSPSTPRRTPSPPSRAPSRPSSAMAHAHLRREERTEAAIILALDVALFAGLAAVDKSQGWDINGHPWWSWLALTVPALILIALLVAAPLAELPARHVRNAAVALLGMLVVTNAIAVGALLVALVGSSAGEPERRRPARPRDRHLAHEHHHLRAAVLDTRRRRTAPARPARAHRPGLRVPAGHVEPHGWSPRLSDYLYVSLTNAIAVSPTDTMPLTRNAKGLMAAESLISYAVVILVVSRAVNVLGA